MKDVIKLSGEMKEINLEEAKEELEYYLIQIKEAIESNSKTLSHLADIQEEAEIDEDISKKRSAEIYEASEMAISLIYKLEETLYEIKKILK